MINSIGDLLPKKRFEEPPEVQIIKAFVNENYQQIVSVSVHSTQIIIHVKGSALAGVLRTRLHELQDLCQTDKRLVIRTGF